MYHTILLVVFLTFLIFGAAYLLRLLFPPGNDEATDTGIKKVGQPEPVTQKQFENPVYFEEPRKALNHRRPRILARVLSIVVLLGCGYILCAHRKIFSGHLHFLPAADATQLAKAQISPATVEGHTVVDGVNWFLIVATSTEGIPFEGWVSENAIQNQPPKENKMADEMMKKLGLPTNRERIESVKQLKKVGQAMKSALEDVRPKGN